MRADRHWLERQLAYMADRRAKAEASGSRAARWLRRLAAGRRGRVRGHLDTAGPRVLTGWARDDARPDAAATVEVVVGGEAVLSGAADVHRADLEAAGLGSGRHGFSLPLPRAVLERAQGAGHPLVIRIAARPPVVLGILDVGPSFPLSTRLSASAGVAGEVPEEMALALVPAARTLLFRLAGTAG